MIADALETKPDVDPGQDLISLGQRFQERMQQSLDDDHQPGHGGLGVLQVHALNRGGTKGECLDTILNCAPYIGFPKTNHALYAAQEVFDLWDDEQGDWK